MNSKSFDSFIFLDDEEKDRLIPICERLSTLLSMYGNTFFVSEEELIEKVLKSSGELVMIWNGIEIPCGNLDFFYSNYSKIYLDINSKHILLNKQIFVECINADDAKDVNIIDKLFTYVKCNDSDVYVERILNTFENGTRFYIPQMMEEKDFRWLSKDFDVICFNKMQNYDDYLGNLFIDNYYQGKLSPKQMLEVINNDTSIVDSDKLNIESPLKYLEADTYRIYEKMGDSLVCKNINQAYLCYENAEFLCTDEDNKKIISQKKINLLENENINVRKTAFIILSYNNKYLMQRCIESIYTNCNPESCRLIIFDNNSSDGVAQWLAEWGEVHDEAVVVLNNENLGFSGGCNAAVTYADDSDDIFLLNNDTRVPANALFWLRMALYSSDEIGATGSVQNYFDNSKDENVSFAVVEKYMEYGAQKNVLMDNPMEEQSKLCGFALLIRRDVWNKIGGFDERFNPGYLEDDDISLNIRSHGYKMMMVHNSFIYHVGSQSFIKRDDVDELNIEHRKIIVEKWGFDSAIYAAIDKKQLKFIDSLKKKGYEPTSSFKVLHIGCGCGNMLGHIHYLYPNAELIGIEENDIIRKYAISSIDVYDKLENSPYKLEQYDEVYIE